MVRRITAPHDKGLHRVSWDLRYPAPDPIELDKDSFRAPWSSVPTGPLVLPGEYSVTFEAHANNSHNTLVPARRFAVNELKLSPEVATDRRSVLEFQQQAADLYRETSGAVQLMEEIGLRFDSLDAALLNTQMVSEQLHDRLRNLRSVMTEINVLLVGDRTVQFRREAVAWSLQRRTSSLLSNWQSQSQTTGTDQKAFEIASAEYAVLSGRIRRLDDQLSEIDAEMNDRGAPWTPGRRIN